MGVVKNRGNKRSSRPTTTTVVLVTLCIVAVYVFSKSSIVSSHSVSRTDGSTTSTATKTSTHLTSMVDSGWRETINKDTNSGTDNDDNTLANIQEGTIKSDDPDQSSSVSSYSSNDDDDKDEKNLEGLHEKESENEDEKQNNLQTLTSEDSVITQNQEVEEQTNNDNSIEEATNNDNPHEDSTTDGSHETNDLDGGTRQEVEHSNNGRDETSNVDQQEQRQQHQQSKQETHSVIREDHIQHDETNARIYEDTTHESKDEDIVNQGLQNQKISSQLLDEQHKSFQETKGDSLPNTEPIGISKESIVSKKTWSTQAGQSENQNIRKKDSTNQDTIADTLNWKLCNVTAGNDYIPCLDNEAAIARLSRTHYRHRERHCPDPGPTCLVPLPPGYKTRVNWPESRDKIWYHNVPHTTLAEVKGHQNWVKVTGEFLTFPGGGTQFIHGASHYIDFIEEALPEIAWGKVTRVILDVGCGVASFGGYLFDKDVLAISFAPKDEHTAQVQFALERGIPAILAVMGTQRLPFPSKVFDLVHCARCRVPWHADGGALLLELNRVLRPGGYFVWSATPVYQQLEEDVQIWKEMSTLTEAMCWKLMTIKKDKINSIGAAIYKKPTSNECYEQRKSKAPPMCETNDDPNAAWYVPLQSCMHRVPIEVTERGSTWPLEWPNRLTTTPYWLDRSQEGIYGKSAPNDFTADYEHWKQLVHKTYLDGLGFSWTDVRNVMDMRAAYGGFAAVLKDLKLWVINVVNIDSPDTLPIIYERGLFGIYHDWCESFSTYPRTYDLLHADHLFSSMKKRCKIDPLIVEIDRVLRPGGKLIVRDESGTIEEVERFLRSLHWEIHMMFSKNQEGMLSAEKTQWRPDSYEDSSEN